MITILPQKRRVFIFSDMIGNEWEGEVPPGEDPDNLCCKTVEKMGAPLKCVPKLIETSSGMRGGEIII